MTTQPLEKTFSTTRQSRPWWALPTILLSLVIVLLLAYGLWRNDRTQLVDGPVPEFTLHTFDGEEIAIGDLQGKPVIINFWASWCRECDKEMQLLQQTHERYGDEIVLLGVDHVDTEAKALAYLQQYGITYPNGPDLGGRIANAFNIKGVPETFFIGPDGTIRGMHLGPLDQAALAGWIAELQNE
ncbi:MAG: TlpA family protein disulfide reductase [Chloroflexota bacterium]|nr:TlpA family protein disulfide reductase [Chloroflexota bacterium]